MEFIAFDLSRYMGMIRKNFVAISITPPLLLNKLYVQCSVAIAFLHFLIIECTNFKIKIFKITCVHPGIIGKVIIWIY